MSVLEPASSEPHFAMLIVLCHISTWLCLSQDDFQERQSHVYSGWDLCIVFVITYWFFFFLSVAGCGPRSVYSITYLPAETTMEHDSTWVLTS